MNYFEIQTLVFTLLCAKMSYTFPIGMWTERWGPRGWRAQVWFWLPEIYWPLRLTFWVWRGMFGARR